MVKKIEQNSSAADRPVFRSNAWTWIVALVLFTGAVTSVLYIRKDSLFGVRGPELRNEVQITNDGFPKAGLVADRTRLFFTQHSSQGWSLVQKPLTAGSSTTILPSSIADPKILDTSPDSELLVSSGGAEQKKSELWVVAGSGGVPRRLGIYSSVAAWAPDGKIVFSQGRDFYRAEHEGNHPVKFASALGPVSFLRVSPGGSRIRFTIGDPLVRTTMWEIQSDGTGMTMLLPLPGGPGQPCCGNWTLDGKYFVYENSGDLWVVPANGSVTAKLNPPVQLTSGPRAYHNPVPGRDSRTLYVLGTMRPTAAGAESGAQEIYAFELRLP